MTTARTLAVCTLVFAAAACGGGGAPQKPAETPASEDAPSDKPRQKREGPSVSQELGEIDQKETERALQKAQPDILACQKAGAKRIDYLAGDVRAFVRLDANGQVHWSYLEGSTLGDRATEKCILGALAKAPWPKPRGGEAEVRKGFAFDVGDAREPANWAPDKMFESIAKADAELGKCKAGITGRFAVTAYVVPDGKSGRVESVGVAPPSKEGEAKVDCIVDVVRGMKPPSPGSYAAKVSFSL
jgi:hypothetical protein